MSDMSQLLADVRRAQTDELIRANANNKMFVDEHQAASVIFEEYEEAVEAITAFYTIFREFWSATKHDVDYNAKIKAAEQMRRCALYAAAECIQTAAMAEKTICSIYDRKNKSALDKLRMGEGWAND